MRIWRKIRGFGSWIVRNIWSHDFVYFNSIQHYFPINFSAKWICCFGKWSIFVYARSHMEYKLSTKWNFRIFDFTLEIIKYFLFAFVGFVFMCAHWTGNWHLINLSIKRFARSAFLAMNSIPFQENTYCSPFHRVACRSNQFAYLGRWLKFYYQLSICSVSRGKSELHWKNQIHISIAL